MRTIPRTLSSFTRREIAQLFKTARPVVHHASLELRAALTDGSHGRILMVIPRVVGCAPKRNQLRRRMREIFYQKKLYARGCNLIIKARKTATSISFAELERLLEKAVV